MEEVEVVTKQEFCLECLTRLPKEVVGIPKPNSLTAARLRLADAAEAREACEEMPGDTEEEIATAVQTWDVADDEYRAAYKAIAALRTARGA